MAKERTFTRTLKKLARERWPERDHGLLVGCDMCDYLRLDCDYSHVRNLLRCGPALCEEHQREAGIIW